MGCCGGRLAQISLVKTGRWMVAVPKKLVFNKLAMEFRDTFQPSGIHDQDPTADHPLECPPVEAYLRGWQSPLKTDKEKVISNDRGVKPPKVNQMKKNHT